MSKPTSAVLSMLTTIAWSVAATVEFCIGGKYQLILGLMFTAAAVMYAFQTIVRIFNLSR